MDNGCFYRYAHKKELGDCEGPVDDDTALCRGHFKNLSIIDQVGMSFEDLADAITVTQMNEIQKLARTHNLTTRQAADLYEDKQKFEAKREERRNGKKESVN